MKTGDRNVVRLGGPASLFRTLAVLFFFTPAAHGQIPNNVFKRVLLIQVGTISGTGFTVDVDGRQYIVTAKHVVSAVKDDDAIRLRRYDGWTSAHVKVLRCDEPIDIAVLIPDKQVTLNVPLEPTMLGLGVGQDTYFLGFPFGELLSNVRYKNVGDVSIAFVKKGIWSASISVGDGAVIYLDGHNNPGFSGGPIIFRDLRTGEAKVAGVIQGYRPDLKPVLDRREIKPDEDLSSVESWRIVTINGKKFMLTDTEEEVDTNSGIVLGYAIESAVALIKKHPAGPKVTEGEPPLSP